MGDKAWRRDTSVVDMVEVEEDLARVLGEYESLVETLKGQIDEADAIFKNCEWHVPGRLRAEIERWRESAKLSGSVVELIIPNSPRR